MTQARPDQHKHFRETIDQKRAAHEYSPNHFRGPIVRIMLTRLFIALSLLAPASIISTHANAESALARFFLAGQPREGGNRYRSDHSPIPRKTVSYDPKIAGGTIIIETSERRLYYTLGNGKAIKFAVGVGREGFEWSGVDRISRKAEWPGWTPPAEMRAREAKKGHILPLYQEGGPNNPLGARAMYIGGRVYRIHGTNQPWTLGLAMSSGCIRMSNNDVKFLYDKVAVGTKVIVRR
jgi:lipoprotein-anchoring transpeptidase ErfK/SrfK